MSILDHKLMFSVLPSMPALPQSGAATARFAV